jgi:hypothetical protein
MKTFGLAIAALVLSSAANAVIFDDEPNNTFATATTITRGGTPWSDVGQMNLGSGDVDFFAILLNVGEIFTVVTTPEPPTFEVPDTYMGLFNSSQTLLRADDDSGNGRGSLIQWQAAYTGIHYVAVTGFGDINFTGNHQLSGAYVLTASIVPVPEPGTLIALSLLIAGLLGSRKVRTRS